MHATIGLQYLFQNLKVFVNPLTRESAVKAILIETFIYIHRQLYERLGRGKKSNFYESQWK